MHSPISPPLAPADRDIARIASSPTESVDRITRSTAVWIEWAPIAIAVSFMTLFSIRPFARFSAWVVAENHPVEMLTFLSLFAAGVLALRLATNRRWTKGDWWVTTLLALFAIGCLVTAMEEIAWGQTFFHFDTPEFILERNDQDELTLHNLYGIEGKNSLLRLIWGIGGLIGIAAARWPRLRRIATPPVLLRWFVVIVILAGFDVFVTFHGVGPRISLINEQLTEVTEMMIGLGAFLYAWLCSRRTPG